MSAKPAATAEAAAIAIVVAEGKAAIVTAKRMAMVVAAALAIVVAQDKEGIVSAKWMATAAAAAAIAIAGWVDMAAAALEPASAGTRGGKTRELTSSRATGRAPRVAPMSSLQRRNASSATRPTRIQSHVLPPRSARPLVAVLRHGTLTREAVGTRVARRGRGKVSTATTPSR